MEYIHRFYRTYEELKRFDIFSCGVDTACFYRTYEELKLATSPCFDFDVSMRFYRTYEELKRTL